MQKDQKKKMKRKIKKELEKSSAMTEAEEDNVDDVWTLRLPDRWQLYRYVSFFPPLFTNYRICPFLQPFLESPLLALSHVFILLYFLLSPPSAKQTSVWHKWSVPSVYN